MLIVGSIVLVRAGRLCDAGCIRRQLDLGRMNIVIGVLLLAVARRQFAKRPADGEQAELPEWTRRVDDFDMGRSVALGFALSAINPKNLLLTVSAAALIAQAGISSADEFGALAIYTAIATIGPAIPVAFALVRGDQGRPPARLDETLAGAQQRDDPQRDLFPARREADRQRHLGAFLTRG